jgi:hypothetical protein
MKFVYAPIVLTFTASRFRQQDSNSREYDGQYRGLHTLLAIFDRHHEAVGEGEFTLFPHILSSHWLSQHAAVLHLCLTHVTPLAYSL